MNIIFMCDVFEYYFDIKKKALPDANENRLLNIFNNPNTKFVVSESYIDLLRQNFNNAPETYELIEIFFIQLFDSFSDRLVIVPNQNMSTVEDEFVALANMKYESPTLRLVKSSNSKLSSIVGLSVYDTPEYFYASNSIKINLASKSSYQLRYFDFNDINEVNLFIKNFINLDEKLSSKVIHIFCRDFSIDRCGHFDVIARKRYSINFYSRSFKNAERKEQFTREELQAFNRVLHNFFGKNFSMYLASQVNLIHERMIVIGGLILTIDDDFNNTDPKRHTWTITVEYSVANAQALLQKAARFREYELRA